MKRAAILALLPVLVACSGAPAPSAPAATPTAVAAATSAPAPAPTTEKPTPTPSPTTTMLQFGQEGSTRSATFVISESKVFNDGRNVQAFMLKACLSESEREANAFTSALWSAIGPEGERYQPSDWSDIQPGYHYEMPVSPGECVKGWLQFDTKDEIVEVRYQSQRGDRVAYAVP